MFVEQHQVKIAVVDADALVQVMERLLCDFPQTHRFVHPFLAVKYGRYRRFSPVLNFDDIFLTVVEQEGQGLLESALG